MTKSELRTLADRFLTYFARNPEARQLLVDIGNDKDPHRLARRMTELINDLFHLDPDPLHLSQFEEFAENIRIIYDEMPTDLRVIIHAVKPYSSPGKGPTGTNGHDGNTNTNENGENNQNK